MPGDSVKYDCNPNDPNDAGMDCDGDGATNLQEFMAATDPCDTIKPTIVAAASSATFDTVVITFSEELDPITALEPMNYLISPSLAVTARSRVSRGGTASRSGVRRSAVTAGVWPPRAATD